MRFLLSKKASLWTCFACALLLPACQNGNDFCLFGYSTAPNYRTDIHTVRVKIFENTSFRPGLEFELTRAVIRQIEQYTPYKVVQAGCPADTEITGKIVSFGKGIMNVNNVNEERDIETTMGVEFSWKDLRSGQFLSKAPRRPFEAPEAPVTPVVPVGPQPIASIPGVPAPTVLTAPVIPGVVPGSAPGVIVVTTTTHYVPEVGQSLALAQQDNIQRMAVQIRQLMEKPW